MGKQHSLYAIQVYIIFISKTNYKTKQSNNAHLMILFGGIDSE